MNTYIMTLLIASLPTLCVGNLCAQDDTAVSFVFCMGKPGALQEVIIVNVEPIVGIKTFYHSTIGSNDTTLLTGKDKALSKIAVKIDLGKHGFSAVATTVGQSLEVLGNNGGLISDLNLLVGYHSEGEIGEILVIPTKKLEVSASEVILREKKPDEVYTLVRMLIDKELSSKP